MRRTKRHLATILMVGGLISAARPVLADSPDLTSMSRVRSSSAAISAVIGRAIERSQTFRRMVETIDASDGIVYVEPGACRRGVRACFVAVGKAGQNRLLRVIVHPHPVEWDLMGSIGHELRHTIEVLSAPRVRSTAEMYLFYAREGRRPTGGAFETNAAIEAGNTVRTEVRRYQGRVEGRR